MLFHHSGRPDYPDYLGRLDYQDYPDYLGHLDHPDCPGRLDYSDYLAAR